MKKVVILLILGLAASLQAGQVFYVSTSGNDANDGLSWATAFADVQKGIDAAAAVATNESPSEVWIAAGTYKHGSAMTMKNNVEIYGGFAGTETSKEERIAGQNKTYLDGNNSYRVFYNNYTSSSPLTNSAKLDNVTIQNGNSDPGGGMFNYHANPEITNCTFSNNTASSRGGGMYNSVSSPILKNCTFTSNGVARSSNTYDGMGGGGMYNKSNSNPELTNCTFSKNYAGTAYDPCGGGMYNDGGCCPIVKNCTFIGNKAANRGGGIYNNNANMILTNCTFRENTAGLGSSSQSGGGGMCNYSASPEITNCVFIENKCSSANVSIGSYYSTCYGGGISNVSASPIITNCTFYHNIIEDTSSSSVGVGLEILNNGGRPIITNCTFLSVSGVYLRAGGVQAAIYNSNSSSIITNCIFRGIDREIYNYNYNSGSISSVVDTCIIQGGSGGDPKLGELGDYGGYVQTIPVLEGSSAIGAGKVVEGVETDARGVVRSTTAPTIGAYEVVNPVIVGQPQNKNFWLGKNTSITISATTVLGGLNYQWQKYENEDWVDIGGATLATLTLTNLTEELNGSKYRCKVSNAIDGGYTISNEATLTLRADATQATLSTNRITIVSGGYGHLSVESDAVEPSYKWYYSPNLGIDWVEIEDETNSSIDFAVDSSMNRRQFKCVVTDGGGTSVESNKAVLIINSSAITISQDIVDELAYIGRESVFTVSAASSSELSYQWQVSTDGGENYQDIEDATANTLALTPTDYSLSGNIYRLKIDNGGGYIYSSAATFTVFKNAAIVKQPADLIAWNAKNAEFAIEASGDGVITYQWQLSADGGENWQDIAGATQSALVLESVSVAMNGNKYRCAIANGGSAGDVSSSATLTVYKTLEITQQPQTAHTFAGDDAEFSVEVDAQGEVLYKWQEFIAGEWLDIEGAILPQFVVENVEAAFDGRKFRVVITNGGDTFISDAAYLRLALPIEITSQPAIIPTAYIGGTAKFTVEVSGYEPQYQWFVSGNYGTDIGVEIPGATAKTLTVSVESEDILENVYFCKITNAKSEVSTELVYIENIDEPDQYQSWAIANGLSGDDALPTATPRNDGITNLEKFAFGLDGAKPASYADSPHFAQSVEGGNMVLNYPISIDAEGALTVKALMSTDLINWSETTAAQTGTSSDGKYKLYKASAAIPEGGKIFLKLKVEE